MTEAGWMLDPQLQGDTSPIGDFALCRVLAINNADYPWLILVPRRAGVREIFELGPADCARLMEEIALASRALKAVTGCDKLNIAAIGNVVAQLHVHIVARWKDRSAVAEAGLGLSLGAPRRCRGLRALSGGDERQAWACLR